MKKTIKLKLEIELEDNISESEMDEIYEAILSADIINSDYDVSKKVKSSIIMLS